MGEKLVKLRALIHDEFTRTAAKHIRQGDIFGLETDDTYIYKYITKREYLDIIQSQGEFRMDELDIPAEVAQVD